MPRASLFAGLAAFALAAGQACYHVRRITHPANAPMAKPLDASPG